MGNLRALSRMPVQVPIYAAVLSRHEPSTAGRGRRQYRLTPVEGPGSGRGRRAARAGPSRPPVAARARATASRGQGSCDKRQRSARTAAQTALPSGLDLLLGRLAGSGALAPQTLITLRCTRRYLELPGHLDGRRRPDGCRRRADRQRLHSDDRHGRRGAQRQASRAAARSSTRTRPRARSRLARTSPSTQAARCSRPRPERRPATSCPSARTW